MHNKFNKYLIILGLLIGLVGCGTSNKNIRVDNKLGSCLNQDNIESLTRYKWKNKKKCLYITEVAFNFEECIGLFRYEYAYARRSAGIAKYVLKGKNELFFQSEDIDKNKEVVFAFIKSYGDFFSDDVEKHIISLFSVTGGTFGKFSR